MAEAAASGFCIPGQESVLAPFRERYFTEALPALDGRETFTMRRLAGALYPVTLAGPATLAATAAALEHSGLSQNLRLALLDQEAIMRGHRGTVGAATRLVIASGGGATRRCHSSRAPRSAGTSTE